MLRKIFTLTFLIATPLLNAAAPAVMLGNLDMREASFWVQTDAPEKGWIEVSQKDSGKAVARADFETTQGNDCTAKVAVGPLEPGTAYQYAINGGEAQAFATPPNFRDRTPPPDFKVAFGGGHYDNDKEYDPPFKTPGGDYKIFSAILAQQPAAMFWLGDATILREGDWGSRAGVLSRYKKARSTPEMKPLLAGVPNLSIWGAGETADGDRFLWNMGTLKEAFRLYWANPSCDIQGTDLNTGFFRWNDVEFFLLDERSCRNLSDPIKKNHTRFGRAQMDWLVEALARSKATFKVIVTSESLLCPIDLKNEPVTTAVERDALFEATKIRGVGGLIFISSGKAFGETTKFVRANGYDLHDFSVGPLTARPDNAPSTINYMKVPGSTTRGHQFGVLSFSGPEENRVATVTVHDADGKVLYTQAIARKTLQ